MVRVVEAQRLEGCACDELEVAILTLDAVHEEWKLGVHVIVEALEKCLTDVSAHLGVAFDSKAGLASKQESGILQIILVIEIGDTTSLALVF